MSSSVETFTLIVLLVVGLPSLDGNHSDDQKSVEALDFHHVCSATEDQLKLNIEKSKGTNLERQHESTVQRSRDITFEQQPQTFSGNLLTTITKHQNGMVTYQRPNKLRGIQKRKLKVQLPIDGENDGKTEHKEPLQYTMQVTKKPQLKTRIRVEMQKNWENVDNSGPVLWKRGQGASAGKPKYEDVRRRFNEPQPITPPPLRTKRNENLASDLPSPTKNKNKLAQLVSDSFSKTRRLLSGNKGSRNSKKEGSGAGLSSGYIGKPSGLGKIAESASLRDSQLPRRTASGGKQDRPYEPSSAAWRAQFEKSADPEHIGDGWSYDRPAKSPEVNQMWGYLSSHSKQWSNVGNSPSPPNHHQQSPNRQGSPSKRNSPPKFESPKSKSVSSSRNAGPRVSSRNEDEDAHHLIKRHKKGWTAPEGIPATDASSSSSPEKDSISENPQSRKSSPGSHSTAPPGRSTWPSSNARGKVRQPSHKELDTQYDAYIARVRSKDGQEKK